MCGREEQALFISADLDVPVANLSVGSLQEVGAALESLRVHHTMGNNLLLMLLPLHLKSLELAQHIASNRLACPRWLF